MARIRSVHPSLYTDEEFMSLSLVARVVLPGLWTECDDHGVFAWKPLTLKARILPADSIDMAAVLRELETANFIKRFTAEGKEFGIVRNFRKYQRPKKPTYVNPFPAEFTTYIGLKADSPPPEENQLPTEEEEPPQMEDGGCRVKDEGSNKQPADAGGGVSQSRYPEEFEQFWKAFRPPRSSSKPDALKAWGQKADLRPPLAVMLRAVAGYNSWLAEESRKRKSEHPKQHPATWLRGEVWNGFMEAEVPDTAELAAQRDRIDQMLRRGKYAQEAA